MYEIPTTITIDDTVYAIRCKGDYRMVLDCFSCLGDTELDEQERVIATLIIFYEQFDDVEDLLSVDRDTIEKLTKEMYNFFECHEHPMHSMPYKLLDWEHDSQLICSAVNKVAHTEVRSVKYLHWWTFLGYYAEVGDSVLSTVVGIRNKIKKGKKLEKFEREFQHNNPHYFIWDSRTPEQKQEDDDIMSVWNKS